MNPGHRRRAASSRFNSFPLGNPPAELFALCMLLAAFSSCDAQGLRGVVTAVKDGDTIELRADTATHRIRLFGIDCPEKGQAFGQQAKKFTSGLCFGKRVSVVTHGRDRYGRVVGEVILPDGRILNRELVAAGLAWWYQKYSRDPLLERLEAEARKARRGIWSDAHPVPPWEFRTPR